MTTVPRECLRPSCQVGRISARRFCWTAPACSVPTRVRPSIRQLRRLKRSPNSKSPPQHRLPNTDTHPEGWKASPPSLATMAITAASSNFSATRCWTRILGPTTSLAIPSLATGRMISAERWVGLFVFLTFTTVRIRLSSSFRGSSIATAEAYPTACRHCRPPPNAAVIFPRCWDLHSEASTHVPQGSQCSKDKFLIPQPPKSWEGKPVACHFSTTRFLSRVRWLRPSRVICLPPTCRVFPQAMVLREL